MYKLKKTSTLLKISLLLIFNFSYYNCSETTYEEDSLEGLNSDEEIKSVELENSTSGKTESDFFTDTSNDGVYRNFVTHYGGNDTSFDVDDSANLQTAIDDISTLGGGRLAIPAGSYTFAEVSLKSNVHLKISTDATIRPPANWPSHYTIFRVTNNDSVQPLENVSIGGVGGQFTVDLEHTNNTNLRVIQSWNVENFKYSDILIKDNLSKYAAIEFNGVEIDNKVYGPRFGVVKNIDVLNAHYGYGVIQLQLGRQIYFEDLYGLGGTTLRIETHNATLYDSEKFTKPNELYGVNIRSEKGNCAVLLSPHFVTCGKVDVRGISSIGSGFAVRVEKGHVTTDEQNASTTTLTEGSFGSGSIIKNVVTTYANTDAQIKHKHFKYMPCDLWPEISNYDGTLGNTYDTHIYTGASIGGALADFTNYFVQFNENDVTITNSGISQERISFFKVGANSNFNCN